MSDTPEIEFFHAPNTRSTGVRVLLAELGAPHRMRVIDLRAGEHLGDAFRAVNPMAKVPALRHGEAVVTEQAAVYLYLADLFPGAGLAPAIGDPLRGPYLRWMVFYGSCFEPAMIERHQKREPGPRAMSPYADPDTVLARVVEAVTPGPYILGARFSAADVLWGVALGWMLRFGLVAPDPALSSYAERVLARPAARAAMEADARLAKAHEAAAADQVGAT